MSQIFIIVLFTFVFDLNDLKLNELYPNYTRAMQLE